MDLILAPKRRRPLADAVNFLSIFLTLLVLWTAGAAKAMSFVQFQAFLMETMHLTARTSAALGYSVIAFEFLCPLLLLLQRTRGTAVHFLTALYVGFCTFNIWRLATDSKLSCECFGELLQLPAQDILAVDFGLVALLYAYAVTCDPPPTRLSSLGLWIGTAFSGSSATSKTLTLALLAGSGFALYGTYMKVNQRLATEETEYTVLAHVPRTDLDRSASLLRGATNSPKKLYVFGDYECPPCRNLENSLERLPTNDHLAVLWHNKPLVGIHPLARKAAVLSNTARQSGSFLNYHQLMMGNSISTELLTKQEAALSRKHADLASAEADLAYELELSNRLGINSTPTLVLDDGGQRLLKFRTLDGVLAYLARQND